MHPGLLLVDEITTALCGSDLVEGLLEVTVLLAEAFGFSRCAVLVVPGDDPHTLFLVAASDDSALTRYPLDLGKYPELRAALEGREPVFVAEAAGSPLLGAHAEAAAKNGGQSLLAIPLLVDRRVMGVLQLRSETRHAPLDDEQTALLRVLARVIGVSLRDGRIETLRDATQRYSMDRYQAERRLRAIEQYRDFFESSADGMVVLDRDGEVLYVNRTAEQLTGYSSSGLIGRTISDIVSPAQRESLAGVIAEAAAGHHVAGVDFQLVTTSREPLRVSVSSSTVMADHDAVVLSFRDVTLARALEEELRKTRDFLVRLIDSTVDAIVAADPRGRVILFNHGAERLSGYTADEVVGRMAVWNLWPPGEAKSIMAQLRAPEHGGVGRLALSRREIVARDGSRVPVELSASIIYGEDGREVASVGILSDLRERLSMEERLAATQEKLLATEKQALIADLAGTTAHELNQPLTSVMGYAELLKKRMGPDDKHVRAVDIILREAERMAAIVRKIGRITRYETKAYVGSTTILDLDKSTTDG